MERDRSRAPRASSSSRRGPTTASYVDPHAEVAGADGLDALVAAAQEQFPGHRFVLAAGPDAHHDRVRFTWQLVGEDGGAVATGIDFAIVADDGRLRAVTGFLEAA